MRGISIETLAGLRGLPNQDSVTIRTLDWLINVHCKELQEPWMPLDEFLKSGFVGLCFVLIDGVVEEAKFYGHKFAITQPYGTIKSVDKYQATKVMPIHKPEPPR